MIAPHQGKELSLMLAGEKHLAVFYDVLTPGQNISEDIIPESAFSPHVATGKMHRYSRDMTDKNGHIIRYVCFTSPGQAWRAEAFFWAKEEGLSGRRPFDQAYEYFIGRLLGYNEADIDGFIDCRLSYSPHTSV